jgi:hypothetical protein
MRQVRSAVLRRGTALRPATNQRSGSLIRHFPDSALQQLDRVVVVAMHGGQNVGTKIVSQFGNARVTVMSLKPHASWKLSGHNVHHVVTESMSDVNLHLRKIGPVDAIIDVSRHPEFPAPAVWKTTFLHLRNGGIYAVRRRKEPTQADLSFTQRLARAAITLDDESASLDSAVGTVTFTESWTMVSKRGDHYLRMRDEQVDRLLPTRRSGASVEVLLELPPGELTSRAAVTSHQAAVPIKHLDRVLNYPPMKLRHYTGRIAIGSHSLLYADGVILPESFRHHLARGGLRNAKLTAVDRQFSVVPETLRPTVTIPGDYYFLDCPFPGISAT